METTKRGALGHEITQAPFQAFTLFREGVEEHILPYTPDVADLSTDVVGSGQAPSVIFIERSGGLTTLLRRWTDAGLWSAVVPLHRGEQGFRWYGNQGDHGLRRLVEARLREDVIGPLSRVSKLAIRRVDGLLHEQGARQRLHLVFPRVDTLEAENGTTLGSELRGAWEYEQPMKHVGLIVSASATHLFRGDRAFSGLLGLSNAYRPVIFSEAHVAELAGAAGLDLKKEALFEVMRLSGGQSLLVDRALAELKGRPGGSREKDRQAVRNATEPIARQWRSQLMLLLKGDRRLGSQLEPYVSSRKRADALATMEEKELFVAGWLGCGIPGGWRIRSDLHSEWARQVLFDRQRNA
jgi:hypothetical protein